jgi:hypothetical protein
VDADNYTYIRYYLSGGSYYWELTHTVSGSVVIDVQRSTTGSQYVWRHMALVRSGNDYKWFRDGTQLGTTATDDSEFTELDAPVTIGGYNGGTGGIGRIDEFRIVNGTAVWTDTFTPPTKEHGLTA